MAVTFKYKPNWYQKQVVKDSGVMTTEELIAESKRMDRYLQARYRRLESRYPRATKHWEKPEVTGEFVDEQGNITDMSKFSSAYTEKYRQLKRKTTTVKGYTKSLRRSIRTFNELLSEDKKHPTKIFNEENIFDLFDFLEDYRNTHSNQKTLDSERIVDMMSEAIRLDMDVETLLKNISSWEEKNWTNQQMLDELRKWEPEDVASSTDYEELL